jgi:membrane protein implicated in regulation of membrane protease activity
VTEAEAVEGVDEAQPMTRAAQLALLSPGRAAFQLAWPGIIEQLIRASGQTVVIAFIGHLGAVATAAVGASLQFTFLLFPVFNALSIGTVALVSRRMGERRAGLDEFQAVGLEGEASKKGGAGGKRMDGGTDVVAEAGQGQLGGSDPTTNCRPGFQQAHRAARLGQHDGGGEPIGAGADDDGIQTSISQAR